MKVTETQLRKLFERYIHRRDPKLKFRKNDKVPWEFSKALAFLEKRFDGEYINLATLGSCDENTFDAHKSHWENACQILDSSLEIKKGRFKFIRIKAIHESSNVAK